MNTEVNDYITKAKPWQAAICTDLRTAIHRALPHVEEALQYGKPHFSIDGKHAAVLHVAAARVSFMVFDAADVEAVPGVLRSMGSGDRKVVDFQEGGSVDPEFIADLLRRTTGKG